MKIEHHPTDDVLWSYAGGQLDEAASLVVATHMALCPRCRSVVEKAESVAGCLMEDAAPVAMSDGALESVLGKLYMADRDPAPIRIDRAKLLDKPEHTLYPEPLRSYLLDRTGAAKWKKLGFGIEYLPIEPGAGKGKAGLMKIAPGAAVPIHGHKGQEMTLILSGGYSDDFGRFARGDVEQADSGTVHQPVVDPDEPCICLAATNAPISMHGWMNSLIARFLPF